MRLSSLTSGGRGSPLDCLPADALSLASLVFLTLLAGSPVGSKEGGRSADGNGGSLAAAAAQAASLSHKSCGYSHSKEVLKAGPLFHGGWVWDPSQRTDKEANAFAGQALRRVFLRRSPPCMQFSKMMSEISA